MLRLAFAACCKWVNVCWCAGCVCVASPPPALPMSPPPPPSINPTPTPTSSPPPPGTPISSPPPPNTPAPTPMPGPDGACPADDWRCASCTTSAGTNSAAGGSIAGCYQCATNAREPAACAKCLESSKVPDIISGTWACLMRVLLSVREPDAQYAA